MIEESMTLSIILFESYYRHSSSLTNYLSILLYNMAHICNNVCYFLWCYYFLCFQICVIICHVFQMFCISITFYRLITLLCLLFNLWNFRSLELCVLATPSYVVTLLYNLSKFDRCLFEKILRTYWEPAIIGECSKRPKKFWTKHLSQGHSFLMVKLSLHLSNISCLFHFDDSNFYLFTTILLVYCCCSSVVGWS